MTVRLLALRSSEGKADTTVRLRSEHVTHGKAGRVVRGLNPVLDLEPKCLPERGRAKGQVAVPIQQDGRVPALPRPVIDANAAGDVRGERRFTAEAESRVGDSGGVKGADAGQYRQTISEVVVHHRRNHASVARRR